MTQNLSERSEPEILRVDSVFRVSRESQDNWDHLEFKDLLEHREEMEFKAVVSAHTYTEFTDVRCPNDTHRSEAHYVMRKMVYAKF